MIIFQKAHPAIQAISARPITQAELREAGQYRNPGEPNAEQSLSSEYSKPRVKWRGLTIAIENPAGSVRRGRNRHGITWEQRMLYDYGEILGTMGVDGDPVDVFLGPNLEAPMVYVVHQRRVNDWENFDEDKCMVGFDSEDEARSAFLSCYSDPRFLGPITAMPVDEFITKVRATKDKPAMIKSILFFKGFVGPYLRGGKIVNVKGYHGRNARATASPGQMSLFGSNTPLGPSPYKGKDPVASTPDMFHEDHAHGMLYHGTAERFDKFDPDRFGSGVGYNDQGRGVYLTTDRDGYGKYFAKEAARGKGDGVVMGVRLRSGTKLLDLDNDEFTPEQGRSLLGKMGLRDDTIASVPKSDLTSPKRLLMDWARYGRNQRDMSEVVQELGYHGIIHNEQRHPEGVKTQSGARTVVLYDHGRAGIEQDREELIKEHERLVQVLNSPSHEDDKIEAKKQAAELKEYREGSDEMPAIRPYSDLSADEKAAYDERNGIARGQREASGDTPDHLLADIPGAKWRRGKGLIAGHYGVEVNGEVVGNYHAKPEDAVAEAKQTLANRDQWAKDKAARTEAIGKMRERLLSGGEATDQDLQLLGLRSGSSGLEWFIPAAAEAFGINSRAVRPHIRDLIKIGHTDMGVKKEFVEPKKALRALAAGIKPNADYNAAVTSTKEGPTDDNPRRKFYVTIAREGKGVSKLAGPFDTHDEAKAHVQRARDEAYKVDPRSAFDAFGTAGIEADEHKPGVLNERLGIGAKPATYTPTTTDDHPAPIPRSLLSMIPDDRREEWKDLHRQQHELHHYELGQVREKLDRLRSKRNKAESAMNEAEAGVRAIRSAPVPDPEREADAQKFADKASAEFTKLTREQDGLVGQHQSLYERIAKLGRAKERIAAGSGELDVDFAAMRKRTASEQQEHEKSMLKMYREHYKAKDEERKRSKGAPMTKAIVFLPARKS